MARKKKTISLSLEDLQKIATDTPVLFLQMIYAHGWMKWVYDSDHENNRKLMYIRSWYKKFTENRL